jgi:DNA gyrase subunit B
MVEDDCAFKLAPGENRSAPRSVGAGAGRAGAPRHPAQPAATAGVLNPKITADVVTAKAAAGYIARRLDALAEEVERGWIGSFVEAKASSSRAPVCGVKDVALIDAARRLQEQLLIRRQSRFL